MDYINHILHLATLEDAYTYEIIISETILLIAKFAMRVEQLLMRVRRPGTDMTINTSTVIEDIAVCRFLQRQYTIICQ